MIISKKFFKILGKSIPSNNLRIFFLRLAGYKIGKEVYIGESFIVSDELQAKANLQIGDRVAISPRVTIVTSSNANNSRIRMIVGEKKGPVIIEKDAWLGTGSIILPNIRIGEGAVVAAGAVVTKDVLPFTIVVGVPAGVTRKLK